MKQRGRKPILFGNVGEVYYSWTLLNQISMTIWECKCICGKIKQIAKQSLMLGTSRSCGCSIIKDHKVTRKKWARMKEKAKRLKIEISTDWGDNFLKFYEDLGPCPDKLRLVRLDKNKGFVPGNVVWGDQVIGITYKIRNQRNIIRANIIGNVYGLLTIVDVANVHNTHLKTSYLCKCTCGKEIIRTFSVINRKDKIACCGCLYRKPKKVYIKKGPAIPPKYPKGTLKLPEYRIWCGIIQRCCNPNNRAYKNYGGRGITICNEWRHDFRPFFAHIKSRPSKEYSIDRIDNDKGYEPGNVRWATRSEQMRNNRHVKWLEFNGEKKTMKEWADIAGIDYARFRDRIYMGWSVEDAIKPRYKGDNIGFCNLRKK